MADYHPDMIILKKCIGVSEKMQDIRRYASLMAGCTDPLFLAGERGTGKTLLARAIHQAGKRTGPFIVLNEGFSPFEAIGPGDGRLEIEKADRGTLCISGPGELSEADQVTLLRYLESGTCGGEHFKGPGKPDVRIIFESQATLNELLKTGRIRLDLYYHLKAHEIFIPPLRERPDDIVPLARHFLAEAAGQSGKTVMELQDRAGDVLIKNEYPGNVEDLRARVFDAVQRVSGPVLTARIFR